MHYLMFALVLMLELLAISEWEMHITAQGPRLRNDLYCAEWDVKPYYTIPCWQSLTVSSVVYTSTMEAVILPLSLLYLKKLLMNFDKMFLMSGTAD